jgi:hypothetical protein
VSLAAAARRLRLTLGADVPPAEHERLMSWQATAQRALGETTYAATEADGQRLTVEQATAAALELAQIASATEHARPAVEQHALSDS